MVFEDLLPDKNNKKCRTMYITKNLRNLTKTFPKKINFWAKIVMFFYQKGLQYLWLINTNNLTRQKK